MLSLIADFLLPNGTHLNVLSTGELAIYGKWVWAFVDARSKKLHGPFEAKIKLGIE